MKKILVTGSHSFVGRSFARWLKQFGARYRTDFISLRGTEWRRLSFAGYDALIHCAGIAHMSAAPDALYLRVNRDLAEEAALKARSEGVRQFVFMSSIAVYGGSAPLGKEKIITAETAPVPANNYGRSKLEAEKILAAFATAAFRIAVVRAPLIYGPGCKGNFPALIRCARRLPFFPKVENRRSMIYIGNLCEQLRLIVDREDSGTFFPQNEAYAGTSDLVRRLSALQGRRIILTKLLNPALYFLRCFTPTVDKVFGSLCYARELSRCEEYNIVPFEQSLAETLKAFGDAR